MTNKRSIETDLTVEVKGLRIQQDIFYLLVLLLLVKRC